MHSVWRRRALPDLHGLQEVEAHRLHLHVLSHSFCRGTETKRVGTRASASAEVTHEAQRKALAESMDGVAAKFKAVTNDDKKGKGSRAEKRQLSEHDQQVKDIKAEIRAFLGWLFFGS